MIRVSTFGQPLSQFDNSTITDAILHVRYTASEDADAFKNGAIAHLQYVHASCIAMPISVFCGPRRYDLRDKW
jgi:hypothetical protein